MAESRTLYTSLMVDPIDLCMVTDPSSRNHSKLETRSPLGSNYTPSLFSYVLWPDHVDGINKWLYYSARIFDTLSAYTTLVGIIHGGINGEEAE